MGYIKGKPCLMGYEWDVNIYIYQWDTTGGKRLWKADHISSYLAG